MRFLTIRDYRQRYGAENHMLRVAVGLAGRGLDVHAAFPRAPGTESMVRDCEAGGIRYWPFELKGRLGLLPKDGAITPCLQMLRLLKATRPDVVQVTVASQRGIWGPAVSCALFGVPLLAVFQNPPSAARLPALSLRQLAWARTRGQRWMAVSEQNLPALERTFAAKPDEFGILYNGIELTVGGDGADRDEVRRSVRDWLGVPHTARLLMTTARMDPFKGHADLLEAAPGIVTAHPDVVFVWAGNGTVRPALEARAGELGLDRHVRFLGYRSDIDRLLCASDLFVFPSHREGGCSSAIREAMRNGVPIVSSNAGGIPEVLGDGVHALLFPAMDRRALEHRVRDALAHPERMQGLANKARERIADFSSERMVEDYLAVLRDLAPSPGNARQN